MEFLENFIFKYVTDKQDQRQQQQQVVIDCLRNLQGVLFFNLKKAKDENDYPTAYKYLNENYSTLNICFLNSTPLIYKYNDNGGKFDEIKHTLSEMSGLLHSLEKLIYIYMVKFPNNPNVHASIKNYIDECIDSLWYLRDVLIEIEEKIYIQLVLKPI